MTHTTDSRQLRLLINGILSAHGIDDLTLEIRIVDSVRKMFGSATPARTREEILASLQKTITGGANRAQKLQDIKDEIYARTRIRAATKEWEEFIEFCLRQEKEGKTISKFLDWWMSDPKRVEYMPSKPDSWIVKWDMAFPVRREDAQPAENFDPMRSY